MKRLSIIQKTMELAGRQERPRYFELGQIEIDDAGQIAFQLFRGLPVMEKLTLVDSADLGKLEHLTSFKPKGK
jgi:hypothetical protein